eukprot:GHVU01123646.1.p1 GENE.GHVU01123646.1~~GHVU01123646.1.p1  ORF type:complete len:272 (-),score=38.73 GHVU01123646.1:128-943(-)
MHHRQAARVRGAAAATRTPGRGSATAIQMRALLDILDAPLHHYEGLLLRRTADLPWAAAEEPRNQRQQLEEGEARKRNPVSNGDVGTRAGSSRVSNASCVRGDHAGSESVPWGETRGGRRYTRGDESSRPSEGDQVRLESTVVVYGCPDAVGGKRATVAGVVEERGRRRRGCYLVELDARWAVVLIVFGVLLLIGVHLGTAVGFALDENEDRRSRLWGTLLLTPLGAVCRYGLARGLNALPLTKDKFFLGTFASNMAACLISGFATRCVCE